MKTRQLFFVLLAFVVFSLQARALDFVQKKNSAGRASLTSDAFYVDYVLDVANFSPELRFNY